MKNSPSILTFIDVTRAIELGPRNIDNLTGRSYPARPLGLFSLINRIKLAWIVFIGDADVLVWPNEENIIVNKHKVKIHLLRHWIK